MYTLFLAILVFVLKIHYLLYEIFIIMPIAYQEDIGMM